METWASYAEQGRAALLRRDYATLDHLINANFDLRTQLYQISEGNLEMIQLARAAGASANFAGSGGAIVGAYHDEETFTQLQRSMEQVDVAVIKPTVSPAARVQSSVD